MLRPVSSSFRRGSASPRPRRGYTLVEIIVATVLTLIMLGAVIAYFGTVGEAITNARSSLEMTDRQRSAAALLSSDLRGIEVPTLPPVSPGEQKGYVEITEGPIGVAVSSTDWARNMLDDPTGNLPDTTVGDLDDILAFTTRSAGEPFVGRFGLQTLESQVAEVIWFVRGRTLYRRVLLVAPEALGQLDVNSSGVIEEAEWGGGSFYGRYDVSVRVVPGGVVPNSLSDLTKPENRFAHRSSPLPTGFPFHPHRVVGWQALRMPTLSETAHPDWFAYWVANGRIPDAVLNPYPGLQGQFDAWTNPHPFQEQNPVTGNLIAYSNFVPPAVDRTGEDVVLNNVIGFDVKVWDPGAAVLLFHGQSVFPGDAGYAAAVAGLQTTPPTAQVIGSGAYVDLGSVGSQFGGMPNLKSGMASPLFVYDTWSTHYESDGVDQFNDGRVDLGTNGFDDDGDGVVDGPSERETSPPYPAPLRGIQIKLRAFEPTSRQVREVTIVQEFLPK